MRSAAACALCIYVAINLSIAAAKTFKLVRLTKVESDVSQLAAKRESYNVALLGSSEVFYPIFISLSKDNFLSLVIDVPGASADSARGVVNLSFWGQLISDDYFWVDGYLKGKGSPKWVVLGVAPRDFYDPERADVMCTMYAVHVAKWLRLPHYIAVSQAPLDDVFYLIWRRICYLYDKRDRVVYSLRKFFIGDRSPQSELEAAEADRRRHFDVSIDEYKYRYAFISQRNMELQFRFLERLLDTCQERQIKVVLINMPLTQANKRLLPGGLYPWYCQRLGETVRAHGASYVNMDGSVLFADSDFDDCVHLNEAGGGKLFSRVFQAIDAEKESANVRR